MNPRVSTVAAMANFILQLEFVGGRRAMFDVSPFLHFPVFQPLKETTYFSRVIVNHGTVAWPGGIDFYPDTLYLDSTAF